MWDWFLKLSYHHCYVYLSHFLTLLKLKAEIGGHVDHPHLRSKDSCNGEEDINIKSFLGLYLTS